jgi:hypothetical protein
MNKVAVRYADGHLINGTTDDFFPGKDLFHVSVVNAPVGERPVKIKVINGVKAVSFVMDHDGNPKNIKRNEFDPAHPPIGRRIKMVFKDGEVLAGTTTGYQPGRPRGSASYRRIPNQTMSAAM